MFEKPWEDIHLKDLMNKRSYLLKLQEVVYDEPLLDEELNELEDTIRERYRKVKEW